MSNLSTLITDIFSRRTLKEKASKLAVHGSKKEDTIWSCANWVKKIKAQTFYFTANKLINLIKFQLDHTYFVFGGKVFAQKIGIPMGTDDGPELANLHLHQQEFEYMKNLQKKNIYKARYLNNTFRYIDDVTCINSGDKMIEIMTDIYGPNLKLNKKCRHTSS